MSNGKRVLVSEDDCAIRALLHTLLRRHGVTVDSVSDGAEAIDCLRCRPYDLIVLDLLTPRVNGFDVLDYLRAERPHLLRRVVVVTACQPAFNGGVPHRVAAVLRKPFDLADFDWIVDRVLYGPRPPRGGAHAEWRV